MNQFVVAAYGNVPVAVACTGQLQSSLGTWSSLFENPFLACGYKKPIFDYVLQTACPPGRLAAKGEDLHFPAGKIREECENLRRLEDRDPSRGSQS